MKNLIDNFSGFQGKMRNTQVNEQVLQQGDEYIVRTKTVVSQSMINAYVKKVKEETGKDLRKLMGDMEIAEELVNATITTNFEVDKISANAIVGGPQVQAQVQAQVEPQTQVQDEAQAQVQAQDEAQAQADFEIQDDVDFIDPQAQVQDDAQAQEETEDLPI